MPVRLDHSSADFAGQFQGFLGAKREASVDVEATVRAIIADVASRGDRALIDYTQKFDRIDLAELGIRISATEIAASADACELAITRTAR